MYYKNTEFLKWIALILMLGDHINKYLLNDTFPILYELGRAAMPLFCFCLASNLSRPDMLSKGTYIRTIYRLFLFGLIASPAYILLGGVINNWWPLNILFTLLTITVICYLLEQKEGKYKLLSIVVFFVAGSIVEFWWPAIALGVSVWLFYKKEQKRYLFSSILSCASLAVINHNFYAFISVPIAMAVGQLRFQPPRFKWFFYVFYPLHLYLILVLRVYLTSLGYLFFN